MGKYSNNIPLPRRDPERDIPDQRHRVAQRILGSDERALKIVWIAVANALEEVDNADK